MHWVVIPFRGAASAKSRLADTLSETARRHVARAMFQHVLNVACQAVGSARVLVVTPSATAARAARRVGASVMREQEPGLNEAVEAACKKLRARGNATATIVAADLPLLEAKHIQALTRQAREGHVGLARDRSGEGTNAVSIPLSLAFEFRFGTDSYRRHAEQAEGGAFDISSVKQLGLAADVDVPSDLALLELSGALETLPASTRFKHAMPRPA